MAEQNKEVSQKISLIRSLFNEIYSIYPVYEKKDTLNENVSIPIYYEYNGKNISFYGLLANSHPITLYEENYYAYKGTIHHYEDLTLIHYLKGFYAGYLNFLVYETKVFHLTSHLKLEKNPTNTYNLKIIFSFWWDSAKVKDDIDFTYFNLIYNDLTLGQTIYTLLLNCGYTKVHLLDIETFDTKKYSIPLNKNLWLAQAPFIHFTLSKNILNANPIRLIDELIEHYKLIENELYESQKKSIPTPEVFYNNLSNELKRFLLKGKELFKVAEDSLNLQREFEIEKEPEPKIVDKEKKSGSLTPPIIFELFKKEYDKDRNKKIDKADRGFRSLSELFTKYGKQYEFSRQSLYNNFRDSDLEIVLEKRTRTKRGGGVEYRIKAKELFDMVDEESLRERFMKERMITEEALLHYNKKEIDKTIQIIEDLLKSPSEQFQNDLDLYLGVSYYLAKCYFKQKNYTKCLEQCNLVLDANSELMDVSFLKIEVLFKLGEYDTLGKILESTKTFIQNVFSRFKLPIEQVKGLLNAEFFLTSVDIEEFFKHLTPQEDLKKYGVFINKKKGEKRYYFRSQVQNIEFYHKNSIGFERLYKFLAWTLLLSIEMERRKLFYSLLNKDHIGMKNSLSKTVELMSSDLITQIFEPNFFFPYLNYFRNHLEFFVGKTAQESFDQLIQDIIPQFRSKNFFHGTFPKRYQEFFVSIKNINDFYAFQKERYRRDSIFYLKIIKFNDLELYAENIYLLAYITEHEGKLESLIQDLKNEVKALHSKKIDTLDDFITEWWDFAHPYLTMGFYPEPIALLELMEEIFQSCMKRNLTSLTPHIETLYNSIKPKILEIENLRKQAQNIIKNRIFSRLQKFRVKEDHLTLNFADRINTDMDPENAFFGIIYPVLSHIMRKKSGKRSVMEITIPDTDLEEVMMRNLEIYRKSGSNLPFNDAIIIHPSKNSFIFKEICVYQYIKLSSKFDNLEGIFRNIGDVLDHGFNEIIIKYPDVEDSNIIQDFIGEIQERLTNDYFDFVFKELEELKEIKLVIVPKILKP